MFGDVECLSRSGITEGEYESGVIEVFIEERSEDWFITYYVYENKCEVVEYIDGNYEHAKETADNLEDAVLIASKWC